MDRLKYLEYVQEINRDLNIIGDRYLGDDYLRVLIASIASRIVDVEALWAQEALEILEQDKVELDRAFERTKEALLVCDQLTTALIRAQELAKAVK